MLHFSFLLLIHGLFTVTMAQVQFPEKFHCFALRATTAEPALFRFSDYTKFLGTLRFRSLAARSLTRKFGKYAAASVRLTSTFSSSVT